MAAANPRASVLQCPTSQAVCWAVGERYQRSVGLPTPAIVIGVGAPVAKKRSRQPMC
jgi:hypothetical protein